MSYYKKEGKKKSIISCFLEALNNLDIFMTHVAI